MTTSLSAKTFLVVHFSPTCSASTHELRFPCLTDALAGGAMRAFTSWHIRAIRFFSTVRLLAVHVTFLHPEVAGRRG
jgi:hypothetical protein